MRDVAITTYIDNNNDCMAEFKWLYNSWIYSKSNEMSDIVVFHNPSIKKEFFVDYPDVKFVPLVPLSEKDTSWKDYKFINSVYFLTTMEASQVLLPYRYVLRTDCDVFITPHFKNLRPRLATFGVGLFAVEPIVAARLAQISDKWGIKSVFNNVGSTVMAGSNYLLQYNHIHLEYCKKLRMDEFKDGYGKWPGWFFGVLTMYAGQLATNSYFGTGITMGGLDVHCMARSEMCKTDYHIHAWHTYDYFSKFQWRRGDYTSFDMEKLNKNCIADYCLFMAGNKP